MSERLVIANEVLLGKVCELLSEGKKVILRAKGNSMRPFILGGEDTIIIEQTTSIRRGDIVLARIDRKFILHRIIRIDGDRIILAGDANLYGREVCCRADICGKAISIIRRGRKKSLTSHTSRIQAFCWRSLLPCRRIIVLAKSCIRKLKLIPETERY